MDARPRVALLTTHPAPYRDATLALVHRRRQVDLKVYLLSGASSRHQYWGLGEVRYPHEVLFPELRASGKRHRVPQIWGKLRGYDVVAISGHQYETLRLALMRCLLGRTPYVWVADSVEPRPPATWPEAGRRAIYRAILRFIVGQMGSAWVPGLASTHFLTARGATPERIFQGAYCLDTPRIIARARALDRQREGIRDRLDLGRDDIVFLFVGRLVPQRGIPQLLAAWSRLINHDPAYRLVIVGQGPGYPWAERFVKEHGLTQVQFVAPVPYDALPPYYAACDAYIQPSLDEPYSLSTAQAAASAKPMVVTDRVGAGADYVIEGKTGYVAEAGSVESLVQAVTAFDSDRDRMRIMGLAAQDIAKHRSPLWAAEQFEAATFAARSSRLRPLA